MAQQPNATLDELRTLLAASGGPVVGRTTVWQGRQALDLRRKKRASRGKRGARLLFLPPYSPDFTPVELVFSKLKTFLRTAQARTREALAAAVRNALDWIGEDDAQNWFHHCGYHIH